MKVVAALCGILMLLAGPAAPHALQPGFLDMKALDGEPWRVFWKMPLAREAPMPIEAVLPETCTPRRSEALGFDGQAFVTEWLARCPGGLQGGEIRIERLEATQTDVLVRYELASGKVESKRLTAATTSFTVPAPQGRWGVLSTYFGLGVEHILRGIDHLMFVFALILLILLIRDRPRLVGAVTASRWRTRSAWLRGRWAEWWCRRRRSRRWWRCRSCSWRRSWCARRARRRG